MLAEARSSFDRGNRLELLDGSVRRIWGALEPGDYTITIRSTGIPIVALIRRADGSGGTLVVSVVNGQRTNGVNALLIKD